MVLYDSRRMYRFHIPLLHLHRGDDGGDDARDGDVRVHPPHRHHRRHGRRHGDLLLPEPRLQIKLPHRSRIREY